MRASRSVTRSGGSVLKAPQRRRGGTPPRSETAKLRVFPPPYPRVLHSRYKNPRIRFQTGEDTGILKLLSKPLASGLSAAATELAAHVLVVLQGGTQFLRQGEEDVFLRGLYLFDGAVAVLGQQC